MENWKKFQVMDNFVVFSFPKIRSFSQTHDIRMDNLWPARNLSNNYVKLIYFSSSSSLTNFWTAAVKMRNATNFPSILVNIMNVPLWKQSSQGLKNTWGFTRVCIQSVVTNYFWAEKLTFSLTNFTGELQQACLPLFQTRDREICFKRPSFYCLKSWKASHSTT